MEVQEMIKIDKVETWGVEHAIRGMINQRKNHKLDEWREFVAILQDLLYVAEISETNL